MKNKGFTLIELLAVIVILAIIALIATPIILNIINDTKASSKERSKELYLDAAAQAIARYNVNNSLADLSDAVCNINTDGNLDCIGITEPIEVEMDGEKPKSGEIIFESGKVNDNITEVNFELKSEFEIKCIHDPSNGIAPSTVGAKYNCPSIAGERNFYVLELGTEPISNSKLEVDEIALILEGNYDTTTQAWCADGNDNSCDADGLNMKLEEIAKAWNLDLNEKRVRLPSIEQIMVADGSSEASLQDYQLTNAWLYNWPDNKDYGTVGKSSLGYWTSSFDDDDSTGAWRMRYYGEVSSGEVYDGDTNGVRPIIILEI